MPIPKQWSKSAIACSIEYHPEMILHAITCADIMRVRFYNYATKSSSSRAIYIFSDWKFWAITPLDMSYLFIVSYLSQTQYTCMHACTYRHTYIVSSLSIILKLAVCIHGHMNHCTQLVVDRVINALRLCEILIIIFI